MIECSNIRFASIEKVGKLLQCGKKEEKIRKSEDEGYSSIASVIFMGLVPLAFFALIAAAVFLLVYAAWAFFSSSRMDSNLIDPAILIEILFVNVIVLCKTSYEIYKDIARSRYPVDHRFLGNYLSAVKVYLTINDGGDNRIERIVVKIVDDVERVEIVMSDQLRTYTLYPMSVHIDESLPTGTIVYDFGNGMASYNPEVQEIC